MSGGQQRFLSEPEAVLVRPGAEVRLACVIQNMGLTSQCRSDVSMQAVITGVLSGGRRMSSQWGCSVANM